MSKDYMNGARKFGCDMCARGQRMQEYIEELEQIKLDMEKELESLRRQLEQAGRSVGDGGDKGGDKQPHE